MQQKTQPKTKQSELQLQFSLFSNSMLNGISAAASEEAKISVHESGTARRRTQTAGDGHYFPCPVTLAQVSSQKSGISDTFVTASRESSAVPNKPGRGRKDLSQLPRALLSYFPWEVPNLLLLLVAGDNSSCTALDILLQDLIRSPEWRQQMHFPRYPVHSLNEKLSAVPVISKGRLWEAWLSPEKGPVVRRQG